MLKDKAPHQTRLEMVTLEELVPKDHLLRLIDRHIDFSFIHDRVKHFYSADNGRPAVDPTMLFKMLFIGYLFGVRSERQLIREIQVNVAYRWFLGLGLTDKVIDASTFSQNRRRRFDGTDIEQVIFDEIVEQAMAQGLVAGDALYTDSTHLKANANKRRHTVVEVHVAPMDYLNELEAAVSADRAAHGKKPLKPQAPADEMKPTKISDTDPEAGYMYRDQKPEGFFYLDHRTVDGRCGIITDTYVTPGNVHDARPYLGRLDRQCDRFGLTPSVVGLDAGYNNTALCHGLVERGIDGVVGYKSPHGPPGRLRKRAYRYDRKLDAYICPMERVLAYSTTDRKGYRSYKSDPNECRRCPMLSQCTQSRNHQKVVVRHVWEDDLDRINENRLTEWGKAVYVRRRETVERSFADAKQLHGHRYARFRGRRRVQGQCLLAAACQNMKKIAYALFIWLLARSGGLWELRNAFLSRPDGRFSQIAAAA